MREFEISGDGCFSDRSPIIKYLRRNIDSPCVPLISIIRLDIRQQKTPAAPRAQASKPKIKLDSEVSRIYLNWVQTEPLDLEKSAGQLSLFPASTYIAYLICILSSAIIFELPPDSESNVKYTQTWRDLLNKIGRGPEFDQHWGPLPLLKINNGKHLESSPYALHIDALDYNLDPTSISCDNTTTFSFSPMALQKALRLGSTAMPFDGSQWLADSIGLQNDGLQHIKKLWENANFGSEDKYDLLGSYFHFEAKCRQIIYGSSCAAHLSNICNAARRVLPSMAIKKIGQQAQGLVRTTCGLHQQHLKKLSKLSPLWSTVTSSQTCYGCLFRPPERILPCGHFICDRCVQVFGNRVSPASFRFRIDTCILCRAALSNAIFNLEPPSAGSRLLSLDGGGCRAVILIQALQLIAGALSKLGIQSAISKNFDLCFGTSAGALIILKMAQGTHNTEQLMREFKYLASRLFRPRKNVLSKITGSFLGGIRALLTDGWMDSSFFNTLLRETLPKGKLFGMAGSNTKIGVTAVRNDSTPCVFGNYNGVYDNGNRGYEFLREDDYTKEVEVWEAGRCSAGIPGYFKPMLLKPKSAYFDDGGLRYNNPVGLVINESKRIWEIPKTLDIVLSIGTGYVRSQKPPSAILHNRSILRVGRHFMASLCGENTWQNLESIMTERYKDRLHRINIELENMDAAIDDPDSMDGLVAKTQQALLNSSQIIEIANILAAAQFYFELDFTVRSQKRILCIGRILNRLEAGSNSLINFIRRIDQGKFFVGERSIKCVPDTLLLSVMRGGDYERHVKFSIPHGDMLDIQVQLSPEIERKSISGFPVAISSLRTANNLSKLSQHLERQDTRKRPLHDRDYVPGDIFSRRSKRHKNQHE